jgi:hypothetical protein
MWIKGGYCCRCGECCVGDPGSENMPRPAVVEGMCPFYRIVDGKGFCSTHTGVVPDEQRHPYYANDCSSWPHSPEEIADKPGCTYTFTWVDD